MAMIEGPLTKLPASRPGFVVVASGDKGLAELGADGRLSWGERVFGGYKSFYQVDTTDQAVTLGPFECPSLQPSFKFMVKIEISLRIVDAKRAVAEQLGAPLTKFAPTIKKLATRIAEEHEIRQTSQVRKSIEHQLEKTVFDAALRISGVNVSVDLDRKAADHIQAIDEQGLRIDAAQAKAKVGGEERKPLVNILASANEMMAEWILTKNPAIRDAMLMKVEENNGNRAAQIEMIKLMAQNGAIEAHVLHDRFGGRFDSLLETLARPVGSSTQKQLPDDGGTPPASS
jgi:hypothetical protein